MPIYLSIYLWVFIVHPCLIPIIYPFLTDRTPPGNGKPTNVVMENLVVKDFEVAGIQLNGAKNVTIRDCFVGPSATAPILATFSSARLIGFYFMFFYRQFWTPDEVTVLLKNNNITFADRPHQPVSLWEVFKRLYIAETVYHTALTTFLSAKKSVLHDLTMITGEYGDIFREADDISVNPNRAAERAEWLQEAGRVFDNPNNLPDGSAIYGINLHRRRKGVHQLGEDAWNFYGPDEDSTLNVRISNVEIKGIKGHSVQVPVLTHAKGGVLTGPTGEVIRVVDMTTYGGQFTFGPSASYKGSVHSDALIAIYKLANGKGGCLTLSS